MAFFKEAPIKALTRDRDAAKANADRLATKLTEAEQAVIATKQVAQRAALSGDDSGLDAAETAERAALHRHGTLGAAKAEADKMLAFLDESIETVNDQKLRITTAAATNAMADEYIEVAAAFDASAAALVEIAGRAVPITIEATGTHVLGHRFFGEIAAATPVVVEGLREHGRRVLNNQAAAEMPTPEKPFVAPIIVRPVTKQVFCMRQVKWTAPEGQRFAPKYAILDLPPDVADRALALKACTPIPGDAWANFKGTYVAFNHHAETIDLDLDAEGEAKTPGNTPLPKALGHTPNPDFVKTIGVPRTMRIVGGRAS
jgi:hypothetical protein